MTKNAVSREGRVAVARQQPSRLGPERGDRFIVVHRDGAAEGVNVSHIRRITAWGLPSSGGPSARLVFVDEPDELDELFGERLPFLVDESLEELLELVVASA